jgi:hypothetical protein
VVIIRCMDSMFRQFVIPDFFLFTLLLLDLTKLQNYVIRMAQADRDEYGMVGSFCGDTENQLAHGILPLNVDGQVSEFEYLDSSNVDDCHRQAAGRTMHKERRKTNKRSEICNLKVNYEFNLV